MVKVTASYSPENDARFRAMLANASQVSQDLRVPFGLISRDFYRSEKAIFQLKGPGQFPPFQQGGLGRHSRVQYAQDGVGVKRLAPGKEYDLSKTPYQKRKLKKFGFDYPLLVATGKLAASMTNPNAAGSVNIITNLSLVIGTTVAYGIYHQSDDPRRKIPLRKFVFIGPEAQRFATSDQMGRLERWMNYLNDHILRQLKEAQHG